MCVCWGGEGVEKGAGVLGLLSKRWCGESWGGGAGGGGDHFKRILTATDLGLFSFPAQWSL